MKPETAKVKQKGRSKKAGAKRYARTAEGK